MKKWIVALVFGLIIVLFNSKFYYPPLPFDSVSKREVLTSLNSSSKDIVKIARDNEYEWYITRMQQGKGYEHIKEMIHENGWKYKIQEGSGFFFDKENSTLIVTTQMWTRNYVLVKIPNTWNK